MLGYSSISYVLILYFQIDCDQCGLWFHDACITENSCGNRVAHNEYICDWCLIIPFNKEQERHASPSCRPQTQRVQSQTKNTEAFALVLLKPKVQICRGQCLENFQYPASPPHNCVARRWERYSYHKDGKRHENEGWRYYHLRHQCLSHAQPNFTFLPPDKTVRNALTPAHFDIFRQNGIIIPNM